MPYIPLLKTLHCVITNTTFSFYLNALLGRRSQTANSTWQYHQLVT